MHEAVLARVRQFQQRGHAVYASIDADAFRAADVPGVSAPNPAGIPGDQALACALHLGRSLAVTSFDLVEISPPHDRDHQSARWAALVVWHFLVGLAQRTEIS